MAFVSHRGRKGSLSVAPAASRSLSSVSLQDGRHFADSRLPDADRLGFEDGSGKVFAKVGGVFEEGRFEGGGSVTHGSRVLGGSGHPVGKVNKFCNDVIVQQGAEDDQPVETGVPFCEFHNIPFYYIIGSPFGRAGAGAPERVSTVR